MTSMTLGSPSVDFGLCGPGPQTSKTVPLVVNSDQPFTSTIALTGPTNSGFVATVFSGPRPTHLGTGGPSAIYGTGGKYDGVTLGNSYEWAATSATNNLVTYVQIDFNPPAVPLPEAWSGLVTLSWPGGSTQLSLTGTTTQLSSKVVSAQPIKVKAGDSGNISLKLEYDSLDAAALAVNIGLGPSANTEFPALPGLTISPMTQNLTPTYTESPNIVPKSGGHSLGSAGGVIGTHETLVLKRIATADVKFSTAITMKPGNNEAAYISVAAPSLPGAIGGPWTLKALFDIAPAPITLSTLNEPLTIIRGQSVWASVSVSYTGANTTLSFKNPASSPGITVPAGSIFIGAGSGTSGEADHAFEVAVANDETILTTEMVTVQIPWTANNGLSTGTLPVSLKILPSVRVINTGNLDGGEGLTGSATWTLKADGATSFIGSVASDEDFADDYAFVMGMTFQIQESNGTSKPQALGAARTGTTSIAIFGETNDSWNESASYSMIKEYWAQIVDAPCKTDLSVKTQPIPAIFTGIGIAVAWCLMCFGGAYANDHSAGGPGGP